MIEHRFFQKSSKVCSSLMALLVLFLACAGAIPTRAASQVSQETSHRDYYGDDPEYIAAIQRTESMIADPGLQSLLSSYGLNMVNVMWEDTGRYKNSSVGPNISDVTIQVMYQDAQARGYQLSLMPVIRYPNFSDVTADIPLDRFYMLVGNEQGEALHKVSLRQYLGNFRQYLHDPDSWRGVEDSLLAERDSYALVSAQAAFLPVPAAGRAEFNPVIFNYQSYQENPAVLVIVATREGTSATIIDNVRDAFPAGFSWGQRLFFNQAGERASFTGERLGDFPGRVLPGDGDLPAAAGESGLNMVMIIQVPLVQKEPLLREAELGDGLNFAAPAAEMKSDVEEAVIGHGEVEGPFTEVADLAIERDERFPVRVTVQFYKATSNGIVSEEDIQAIADQIQRVYEDAAYVGSLVVEGETGRPTEYEGPKVEPPGWWEDFWQRFESNTGMTRQDALALWRRLKMSAGYWLPFLRW